MKIIEQFATIQGEGKHLGTPSYFVRTTGCNLRCEWNNTDKTTTKCDTPYTSWKSEKGYDLKVEYNQIPKNIKHIVITGGEPTIQKDLESSVKGFMEDGYEVTVETNGTRYVNIPGAFMSISPKLKSSYPVDGTAWVLHAKNNQFLKPTSQYMKTNDYQLKFVVNSKKDIKEVLRVTDSLRVPNDKIYLMPQGITKEQFKERQKSLVDLCMEYGFNYTPRLHIDIWGNERGR